MSHARPSKVTALALFAATLACAPLPVTAGPAPAAAMQAGALSGASNAIQTVSEYRRDRIVKRRHARDVEVDAPTTYVRSRRGHVIVDAPFAHVERSRAGVHVRAPFVDLWVPRH